MARHQRDSAGGLRLILMCLTAALVVVTIWVALDFIPAAARPTLLPPSASSSSR